MLARLLLLFSIVMSPIAAADNAVDREYALKSGFILNFARYTQQGFLERLSNGQTLNICSPSQRYIEVAELSFRRVFVFDREVKAKLIEDLDSTRDCHLIFITKDVASSWYPMINSQTWQQTYIIGETEDVFDHGGHIRFFISHGKIRFEVSTHNMARSNLVLSSKVLRLARLQEQK